MTSHEPTLRVRINQIDYTVEQAGPLDNSPLPKVPIIRIFGESSVGKKACVHIHQVYPYFFVEYPGKINPNDVNQYIATLHQSLNHAIAISLKRSPRSRNSQYVRAIILVKGVHFYGFHASYTPFLKVHIVDPALVNRATTLLRSGTIMKTQFSIYESHLGFILQFLSDFGLYGCGWIDLAMVWRREREGQGTDTEPEFRSHVSPYFRQSNTSIELDVPAHQILNRHLLNPRNVNHKLTIPAPPLPEEPVVLSVRELWEDERRRRAERGLSPSPPMPREPSGTTRGAGGDWTAEVRYWDEIRKRIEKERDLEPEKFEEKSWERWVMTTFESIEALWEDEWKTWKPRRREKATDKARANPYEATVTDVVLSQAGSPTAVGDTTLDIDEAMLASQEISRLMEHEEEEEVNLQGNREDENEAERVEEEGPPPEQEYGENTPVKDRTACRRPEEPPSPSKLAPRKRWNPFVGAWNKMSRSPSVEAGMPLLPVVPPVSQEALPPSTGPILDLSADNPFLDDDLRGSYASSPKKEQSYVPIAVAEDGLASCGTGEPSTCNESSSSSEETLDIDQRPLKRRRLLLTTPPPPEVRVPSTVVKGTPFPRMTPKGSQKTTSFTYDIPPPSTDELLGSLEALGVPQKIYRDPLYSNEEDVPDFAREYAGLVYQLKGGDGVGNLEEWENTSGIQSLPVSDKLHGRNIHGWEYAGVPPGQNEAKRWLRENPIDKVVVAPKKSSQIRGPTQLKVSPPSRGGTRESGNMTAFSLEIFAPSQGNKLPDSGSDEIGAIFYALYDSNYPRSDLDAPFQCETGILVRECDELDEKRLRNWHFEVHSTELDLVNRLIDIVLELDPDILLGWEVQTSSWGYLNARANNYGLDLGEQVSRAPSRPGSGGGVDQWGLRTTSTFKVVGRHVFNMWRLMRTELNLTSYSFKNAVFHTLHRRTPQYSPSTLTAWYRSDVPEHVSRLLSYYTARASMELEMLEVAEVISKNSEFARVFGVDFFSVFSRGSQFKVESFMFRIAKPESFVLLSPSKQDVGKQNAAECMPLIMEPLSAFYNSPLVVLDFQSLYPSVMIAYNYCYSTCLGRVTDFKGQNKLGVADIHRPPGLLETVQEHINVSPNGMVFVKPIVRRGLLGRMLAELLDTRVMVKSAMKGAKDDKALLRVLNARQLSLKFIANVTYGYTSASFSGRMPAVEIADAIVQTGREMLEKAIRLIDATKHWGAKVVYGDTDSLFIYLRGKTKDQAFRIGHDIADTITAMNPAPIKLKFEKVYLPCVLLAKKRYVGFKYETPDDTEPGFDAKGIETVRRDGIPAQQKMTETCLKILFRTQDLSLVKEYCTTTWGQILENRVSVQDFIFAKEVRLGTYADGVPPPGAAVAADRMMKDPNDEPQYGDRIPYVIIRKEPGARLVDRAVRPEVLLNDSQKRIDAAYYISKVLIPPLERIFNLVGADVRSWYDEMPKALRVDEPDPALASPRKAQQMALLNRLKIDEHFASSRCLTCGVHTEDTICESCCFRPPETISALLSRIHRTEQRLQNVHLVCGACSGTPSAEPIECVSLDCPWMYERKKLEGKAETMELMHELIDELVELTLEDENGEPEATRNVDIDGDDEPLIGGGGNSTIDDEYDDVTDTDIQYPI